MTIEIQKLHLKIFILKILANIKLLSQGMSIVVKHNPFDSYHQIIIIIISRRIRNGIILVLLYLCIAGNEPP